MLLSLTSLFGKTAKKPHLSADRKPTESAIASTLKVCVTFDDGSGKCGSGVAVTEHLVLTEYHVISPNVKFVSEGGEDSATVARISLQTQDPVDTVVLRHDTSEFEDAIVVSSDPAKDLAILKISGKDLNPAMFGPKYRRDDLTKAIGNPNGQDFDDTDSIVTGTYILRKDDDRRNLIMIDSRNNNVRPGYSGGGVFLNGAVIGLTELCAPAINTCLAIPSKEILSYLDKNKVPYRLQK